MKILIGSKNPGKIQGAKEAFEKYFDDIEIQGIPVSSDVSEAEDISGAYPYFVYEKRITMSEHTSLSRPCARHNSYASFSGLYGLLLLLVKVHKVRPLR